MSPRIAFSTLAFPDATLAAAVGAGRRWGYTGVELRLIDGELIDPSMPAPAGPELERMRRVAGTAREIGTTIGRGGTVQRVQRSEGFTLAARSLKSILNDVGIPRR